jgi:hypothetical protein
VKPPKRKISNAAKTMIAAVLGILVVLLAWMLIDRQSQNREKEIYNEMIRNAAKGDAAELPVTKHKLETLLRAAVNVGANEHRQTVYKALFLARSTDGSDVDKVIAEFATTTSDARSAVSALQAVRFMAGEVQFDQFISVIQTTTGPTPPPCTLRSFATARFTSSAAATASSMVLRREKLKRRLVFVRSSAMPMPTMPAVFSVPLRRPVSWPLPVRNGSKRRPLRRCRAPTPFGP